MAMVTAVFVASGIKDTMAEEWEPAVLKLIVVVEMWTIEYLAFKLWLYRRLLKDTEEKLSRIADALENGSEDESN